MLRSLVLVLLFCALTSPAAARGPRTLRLRFPVVSVEPGEDTERCVFVRVPLRSDFDVGSWEIRTRGSHGGFAPRHFLVYLYTGDHLSDWSSHATAASRGCLDFGPDDRNTRNLIATSTTRESAGLMPPGVALRLTPSAGAVGFILDAQWANDNARPGRVVGEVVLFRASPHAVHRLATPFLARTAELGLEVPPNGLRSTEDSTAALGLPPDAWQPDTDSCVFLLSGHMHKRGRLFAIDPWGPTGPQPVDPLLGFGDPFQPTLTHLFATIDYTDPGYLTTPRLVRSVDSLRYECWSDNGRDKAPRLGCEEVIDVPPGRALGAPGGGPARPCRSPADCGPHPAGYPGRTFTGACVVANLTAGTTSEDEVCALAGLRYDPAPGGGCDVGALAPGQ
jgi:hypothetical protein